MVEKLSAFAWLIPFFPASGALLNGLLGRRFIRKKAHWVALPATLLAFLFSLALSGALLKNPHSHEVILYSWIPSSDFEAPFGFLFDSLSAIMLLVITGVGFLVHVYSVGYMHDDEGYARYFCYLNLFVFFMLILVLANNYLLMFLGWEGVGLCSYLLIGFWFHKKSAADAAKKAFIVNRIGDAGFILGILLLFFTFGTVSYRAIFEAAPALERETATVITLLLFVGALGKSAQIPLHVWLPDAMEGPTPVSALIHAATMVTAGIYMVARNQVLYTLSPFSMEVVAVTGAATALFAGTIATVQNDLKKVLAYSTVSQLGFMFLGLGVGAFVSGMFHLVTHAFFKGLLFLGAGSVIHAASGEQNIQKLGGLQKQLPVTFVTFLVGTLAIAGIPPLAGFWSKDEILGQAFQKGHPILFGMGALAAALTSFYMFRLLYLTFFGKTRLSEKALHHLHESPPPMTFTLVILAILSLVGGLLLGFPPENGFFHHFLAPSFESSHEASHPFSSLNLILMGVSVGMAGIGWFFAWFFYRKRIDLPAKLVSRMTALYTLLLHKYWIDELYDKTVLAIFRFTSKVSFACDRTLIDGTINGIGKCVLFLSKVKLFFDQRVIDGAANAIAALAEDFSGKFRKIQTGEVQNYALTMVSGLVLLVGFVLLSFK